ncbi:TetR/AcrR family transcriptional regulator [Luteimonas arsenica]|uniref:TetR/AcrR family transcriptional regulator n=1 Tax=Luteimonas arsenica TaxID=1586242 RepID=UPI001056187E|nr:TetR/AcrR family transcriptional regulator [Luteimonas arsenica]
MPKPSDSQAPQRPAPGRPKDLAKRASILEAAKCMFLAHGFEGVSMDQIAARAGVSKLTVYSHFGDKEALFVEAVEHYCDEQVPAALFTPAPEQPLRPRLLGIARAVHALIASPEAVSAFRLMCTPVPVGSQLPDMFWNAGAGHLQAGFAALLERRTAAGELAVDDFARAAGQFFALLKGDLHPRLLMGCGAPPGYDAEAHIAATVDMFLRAYAPPPAP